MQGPLGSDHIPTLLFPSHSIGWMKDKADRLQQMGGGAVFSPFQWKKLQVIQQRTWMQGGGRAGDIHLCNQSATGDLHASSVFLKIKKDKKEDAHYSNMRDHELLFASLILKLLKLLRILPLKSPLPWSWFNSLKANSILCPFYALLVSYLLTQEMIDQLICWLCVSNG